MNCNSVKSLKLLHVAFIFCSVYTTTGILYAVQSSTATGWTPVYWRSRWSCHWYYLYPFLPYKSEGVGTREGDYGYEWNMASLAVGSVWEGDYWVLSKSLLLSVPSKSISIALILFVLLRTFFFPFAPPVCFHSVSLSVSFLSFSIRSIPNSSCITLCIYLYH